jgi:gamma-tubulin complex component 2
VGYLHYPSPLRNKFHVAAMSSSSNVRATTQTERRSIHDNSGTGKPRLASGSGGSKSERPDGKRSHSPQPSVGGAAHKRMPSGPQRASRNIEERRTERVHVTTRETLTSRVRSPERRPAPSVLASERSKPGDGIKPNMSDLGIKSSRTEQIQGECLSGCPSTPRIQEFI